MSTEHDGPGVRLAEFVTTLRSKDIPPAVRDYARLLILDSVGAGLYGATGQAAGLVYDYARAHYQEGAAVVWGRQGGLDSAAAALVNATQAHEFELDDYVPPAKLHPGAVIVPATLAVADEKTSGAELITAVVAAYDVMVRISLAANAAATRNRGWHMTGLAGPFGATAAAGRALGLDADALTSAFGIAGSCSGGLFAFTAEGSMTKCFHAGRAAESGVLAASLAARGFTGPSRVLDAPDGGLLWAVSDEATLNPLTSELGTRFGLAHAAVKPYPCCGSIHSSIDATLQLCNEHGLTGDDIADVVAANSSNVLKQCGFTFQGSGGMLEARMSLQYCMAVAAVDGTVGLRQFEDDRRNDPSVRALASRVRFTVDPEIDRLYPRQYAARVTVETRTGERFEKFIPYPLGTPQNAITPGDVEAKFLELTRSSLPHPSGALLELLRDLESLDSIGVLQRALGGELPRLADSIG